MGAEDQSINELGFGWFLQGKKDYSVIGFPTHSRDLDLYD